MTYWPGRPDDRGARCPIPLGSEPTPLWAIVGEPAPYGWEMRNPVQIGEAPGRIMQLAQAEGGAEQRNETDGASASFRLVPIELPGMGTTHVDSSIAPNIRRFLDLNRDTGVPATFNEGFRTTEDQVSMNRNPSAITPAAPGMSLHEAGRAFDLNWNDLTDNEQETLLQNAKEAGFSWGGRFRSPDKPHFYIEVPGGLEARRAYVEGMKKEFRRMQETEDRTP